MSRSVLLTILLLSFLGITGVIIVRNAPEVELLESLFISSQNSQTVVLGRTELGQSDNDVRSAGRFRHLALQQREDGWWFANFSPRKRIYATTLDKKFFYAKRIPLEQGDRIHLGDTIINVNAVTNDSLILEEQESHSVAAFQKRLVVNGKEAPSSFNPKRILRGLTRNQREQFLFRIGGTMLLEKQWPVPGIAYNSASIVFKNGVFSLAPGREPLVYLEKNSKTEEPQTFYNQWYPLDQAATIIAGRTSYSVKESRKGLYLIPQKKIDVFAEHKQWLQTKDVQQNVRKRSWIGGGTIQPWTLVLQQPKALIMPAVIVVCFALFILLFFFFFLRLQRLISFTDFSPIFFVLLFFSFLFYNNISQLGITPLLVLCWSAFCWTSIRLFRANKMRGTGGWLWAVSIFLAGSSILTLLQLYAGAGNTLFQSYAVKQIWYITLAALGLGIFANMSTDEAKKALRTWGHLRLSPKNNRRLFEWSLLFCYAVLLALLGINFLFGTEKGVFGFQPSELIKLLIAIIAALVLTNFYSYRCDIVGSGSPKNRLQSYFYIFSFSFFLLFSAMVCFVSLSDFSPLIIVVGFLGGWLYQLSNCFDPSFQKTYKNAVNMKYCLLSIFTGILLLGILAHTSPEDFDSWPQNDRIRAWSNPAANPHSSEQVRMAMSLIREGGFFGKNRSWTGDNLGGNALPAVQDDFLPGFFVYRFGLIAAVALLVAQFFYLFLLLHIRERFFAGFSNNWWQGRIGIFWYSLLGNLIIIHLLQWGISWSNSLNLLPVMGQPMTWLSSGTSHLYAVGYFTLCVGLFLSWIADDV